MGWRHVTLKFWSPTVIVLNAVPALHHQPSCTSIDPEARQHCETAGCRGEGEQTKKTPAMPRKLDSDTRIHFRTYEVSVCLHRCTKVSVASARCVSFPAGRKLQRVLNAASHPIPLRLYPIPSHPSLTRPPAVTTASISHGDHGC